MLSSLLSDLKSPFPADKSGNRPPMDLETAYVLFAMTFYMGPVIEIVFGQRIFTLVTQPTFVLLYAANAYFLYRSRDRVVPFIKSGGLIWLVIFLPILSTLWSPYPDVTFRRAFGLVNNGLFGIYLGSRYSLKELLYLLRYIFIFIVAISLVFAVVFPQWGLMQESHRGAFRGVFIHKNSAAVRFANAAIIYLIAYIDRMGKSQAINIVGLVLSCGMVVASQSTTGLGALLLSLAAIPFLFIPRGKIVQILPAIFGMLFVAFVCTVLFINNSDTVLAAFGEDSNLTGRGTFWPILIDAIYDKFWFGYGYQGYWSGGLEGPSAILTQLATTGTKAQAHNGFLEMLLSVGFVGLAIFLCSLWSSFLNLLLMLRASRGFVSFFPMLFLVQFFAQNMVEVSMYNFNNLTWVLYIYLLALAAKWKMQRRAATQFQQLSSSV